MSRRRPEHGDVVQVRVARELSAALPLLQYRLQLDDLVCGHVPSLTEPGTQEGLGQVPLFGAHILEWESEAIIGLVRNEVESLPFFVLEGPRGTRALFVGQRHEELICAVYHPRDIVLHAGLHPHAGDPRETDYRRDSKEHRRTPDRRPHDGSLPSMPSAPRLRHMRVTGKRGGCFYLPFVCLTV